MRTLVIGGTRFVGRHLTAAALATGHEVTLFHRGRTGADLFPAATHLVGDRDNDLSALATGEWDATVDACAYVPRQVDQLADALDGRGGHHLLVSSVSAYADPPGPGAGEDSALAGLPDPTVEQVNDETYGGLKVLCERAAVQRHGDQTLLVRPTYVVGPEDYTWRFPWWVARLARGGEVLVPGPSDAPAQLVDGRDLGAFLVGLLEQGSAGAFHAVGPSVTFTWREQVEAIFDVVAPPGTVLTWVDRDFLLDQNVTAEKLPLWSGDEDGQLWVMAMDPAKALSAGLRLRPLADTVRDTLGWTRTVEPPADAGLDATREATLLESWHSQQSQHSQN